MPCGDRSSVKVQPSMYPMTFDPNLVKHDKNIFNGERMGEDGMERPDRPKAYLAAQCILHITAGGVLAHQGRPNEAGISARHQPRKRTKRKRIRKRAGIGKMSNVESMWYLNFSPVKILQCTPTHNPRHAFPNPTSPSRPSPPSG